MIRLTKPPYKSSINSWYTKALFAEVASTNNDPTIYPVFSLYEDKPDLINAQSTFVEIGDPTGYKWAKTYLGSFNHWLFLMKSEWFREAYDTWLEELNTKMRAAALDRIEKLAKDDEGNPAVRLQASKYIAGRDWDKKARGRPSKDEIAGQLRKEVSASESQTADLKRIGLRLVGGTK